MTEILKCPFCGSELENACAQVIYFCPKDECDKTKDWYASKQVWRALINGNKTQTALNVAIDALSKIDTFNCPGKGLIETAAGMVSIANSALYEITSITKQEE